MDRTDWGAFQPTPCLVIANPSLLFVWGCLFSFSKAHASPFKSAHKTRLAWCCFSRASHLQSDENALEFFVLGIFSDAPDRSCSSYAVRKKKETRPKRQNAQRMRGLNLGKQKGGESGKTKKGKWLRHSLASGPHTAHACLV